jgi:nitrate/TMAO reductase-like tetraheme cytochrome c subunit
MKSFRDLLSPVVHLSQNWISRTGVVLVTTAAVFWLFLLGSSPSNPYIGLLLVGAIPGAFFLGLALIPLGVWRQRREERRAGTYPTEFRGFSMENPEWRKLVVFLALTTFVNVVIAAETTYSAVHYMDSVQFCGQTCHSVMQPEYTAYQQSPHSRVECVKCHIGPGASWFVKSKLSGLWQVVSVTFDLYQKPIPVPVHNLRPARDICESCHWPQKYGGDLLRVIPSFDEDEANTPKKTVLMMHIGKIHRAHQRPGMQIYFRADAKHENIPLLRMQENGKPELVFRKADYKGPDPASLEEHLMDCMDCHTRPSHAFELPERAVNRQLAAGSLPHSLPFVRKTAVEILKSARSSDTIPAAFESFYKEKYPGVYTARTADIQRGARSLKQIFDRNVFPQMNITWGTYANHIGHTDFTGCFRCHDDNHKLTGSDRAIGQDCNSCHSLLAMEEPSPKILDDLGLASQ